MMLVPENTFSEHFCYKACVIQCCNIVIYSSHEMNMNKIQILKSCLLYTLPYKRKSQCYDSGSTQRCCFYNCKIFAVHSPFGGFTPSLMPKFPDQIIFPPLSLLQGIINQMVSYRIMNFSEPIPYWN